MTDTKLKEFLADVEKHIDNYWNYDYIDVDTANQIVDECETLIVIARDLDKKSSDHENRLKGLIVFQNIVEREVGKDEFYRLLGLWRDEVLK